MAQVPASDYPIPNSTGSDVRADLNRNLDDLHSTASGTTPPPAAGSAIGKLWVNTSTTPDTLCIKTGTGTTASNYTTLGNIAANFGHATEASPTFTGNIGFPAGSATSLPIRNAADTDTGIYFGATNELDIRAGNTDAHTFTSTASEPKLPLRGTNGSAGAPSLSFASDPDTGFYRSNENTLVATTGGVERAWFDLTGFHLKSQKSLILYDNDNSNHLGIRAPQSIGTNYILTLPNNDGNPSQFLQTDGNGVLSWATQTSTTLNAKGFAAFNGANGATIRSNKLAVSRTGVGTYTLTIDASIRTGSSAYCIIIGNLDESGSLGGGDYTTGSGSSPNNTGRLDNFRTAWVSSRSTNTFNIIAYTFDSSVAFASTDDSDRAFTYRRMNVDPDYITVAYFA